MTTGEDGISEMMSQDYMSSQPYMGTTSNVGHMSMMHAGQGTMAMMEPPLMPMGIESTPGFVCEI